MAQSKATSSGRGFLLGFSNSIKIKQKRYCMNVVEKAYEIACEKYGEYGVDVSSALARLDSISISIHAWQGDDVVGFEKTDHNLTGGCQVTGN